MPEQRKIIISGSG